MKITFKRGAAMCLSVMLSLCIFVSSSGKTAIESHADNNSSETDINPVYSKRLSQLEEKQKQLENEIAAAEEEIQKSNDNAESLKIKYSALQKQIKSYKQQALQMELEIAEVDSQLRNSQNKLEVQQNNIEKSTNDFMKRIRSMYVAGAANSYSDVLLDSQDFFDILMRTELVKRVARHDNEQLNALLEEKRKIEETQEAVKNSLEKLRETSATYVKKQKELADKEAELVKLQNEEKQNSHLLNKQKAELSKKSAEVSEKYGIVSRKAAETTVTTTKPQTTTTPQSSQTDNQTQQTTTTPQQTQAPASQNQSEETKKSKAQTTQKPADSTAPQTSPSMAYTTENEPEIIPDTDTDTNSSKIDKVLAYAKSNVGGAYVWGGSNFRATDCSGLVMLSYAQVGISLPHLASSQASYGTSVSYENMKPGDLIFFGYGSYSSIYHVAIYIGNGLMVHAANSSIGIVISDVAGFSASNNITAIKRIIQ